MAGKLRILHLEDEPRDTELMIAALRAAGIDRMEAHALWRKERPGIPFIFLWGSTGAKAVCDQASRRVKDARAHRRKVGTLTTDRKFVHDMKNMLGIVIGYSNLLFDEIPAGDPKRDDVGEIRRAGESALALLNSLADAPEGEELT